MAEYENENPNIGKVIISEEVVAVIAGMEAIKVDGVAGMSGGITDGINDMLGIKNLSKGVKVDIDGSSVVIDCNIITNSDCKIPDVAWEVQEKVKNIIEIMTGLSVSSVNINVQGIKY